MLSLKANSLLSDDDISFNMSLHNFKQSCGRYLSKYKYDKYYAADKLLDERSIAFYKNGIAWAPGSFNDFNNSANDICSFSFI